MKKWMLFAGDHYYPRGGFDDFRGSYDTLGECMVAYFTVGGSEWDWGHAVLMGEDGAVKERSYAFSWPKNMAEKDYGDVDE